MYIAPPEIIDVFLSDERYFCVVRCRDKEEFRYFRFGITLAGYYAFQHMYNLRPFDAMPGVVYRYFLTYNGGRTLEGQVAMRICIMQGNRRKNFNIAAPEDLIKSLVWIARQESLAELEYIEIPERAVPARLREKN